MPGPGYRPPVIGQKTRKVTRLRRVRKQGKAPQVEKQVGTPNELRAKSDRTNAAQRTRTRRIERHTAASSPEQTKKIYRQVRKDTRTQRRVDERELASTGNTTRGRERERQKRVGVGQSPRPTKAPPGAARAGSPGTAEHAVRTSGVGGGESKVGKFLGGLVRNAGREIDDAVNGAIPSAVQVGKAVAGKGVEIASSMAGAGGGPRGTRGRPAETKLVKEGRRSRADIKKAIKQDPFYKLAEAGSNAAKGDFDEAKRDIEDAGRQAYARPLGTIATGAAGAGAVAKPVSAAARMRSGKTLEEVRARPQVKVDHDAKQTPIGSRKKVVKKQKKAAKKVAKKGKPAPRQYSERPIRRQVQKTTERVQGALGHDPYVATGRRAKRIEAKKYRTMRRREQVGGLGAVDVVARMHDADHRHLKDDDHRVLADLRTNNRVRRGKRDEDLAALREEDTRAAGLHREKTASLRKAAHAKRAAAERLKRRLKREQSRNAEQSALDRYQQRIDDLEQESIALFVKAKEHEGRAAGLEEKLPVYERLSGRKDIDEDRIETVVKERRRAMKRTDRASRKERILRKGSWAAGLQGPLARGEIRDLRDGLDEGDPAISPEGRAAGARRAQPKPVVVAGRTVQEVPEHRTPPPGVADTPGGRVRRTDGRPVKEGKGYAAGALPDEGRLGDGAAPLPAAKVSGEQLAREIRQARGDRDRARAAKNEGAAAAADKRLGALVRSDPGHPMSKLVLAEAERLDARDALTAALKDGEKETVSLAQQRMAAAEKEVERASAVVGKGPPGTRTIRKGDASKPRARGRKDAERRAEHAQAATAAQEARSTAQSAEHALARLAAANADHRTLAQGQKRVRELEAIADAAEQRVKDLGNELRQQPVVVKTRTGKVVQRKPGEKLKDGERKVPQDGAKAQELRDARAAAQAEADEALRRLDAIGRDEFPSGAGRTVQEDVQGARRGGTASPAAAPARSAQHAAAQVASSQQTRYVWGPAAGARAGQFVTEKELRALHRGDEPAFVRHERVVGTGGTAPRVQQAGEGYSASMAREGKLTGEQSAKTHIENEDRITKQRLGQAIRDTWALRGADGKADMDIDTAERIAAGREGWSAVFVGNKKGIVVPTVVKEMWDADVRKGESTIHTMGRIVSRQFVRTVLPFSVAWHAGNVVGLYAQLALAGDRTLLRLRQNKQLLAELDKQTEKLNPRLRDVVMGSLRGHAGTRQTIHRPALRDLGEEGSRLQKAIDDVAKFLRDTPAGGATRFYNRQVDRIFDFGAFLEKAPVRASAASAARKQAEALGIKASDHYELARKLAKEFADNPDALDEFHRRTLELTGDYLTMSTTARNLTHGAIPFYTWIREANKFVFRTLPKNAPIRTALMLQAAALTADERARLGLNYYLTEEEARGLDLPIPRRGYLTGAIDAGKGMFFPTTPFTMLAMAGQTITDVKKLLDGDFPSDSAGQLFPYISRGVIEAVEPDENDLTPAQEFGIGVSGSMIPGVRQVVRHQDPPGLPENQQGGPTDYRRILSAIGAPQKSRDFSQPDQPKPGTIDAAEQWMRQIPKRWATDSPWGVSP